MKFRILLFLVVIFTVSTDAYTQELSKTEKKSLKKEIKSLLKDPAKYKFLKESLAVKETIVQEQTAELISLDNENSKNKNRLDLAKDSISLVTSKLEKTEYELQSLKSSGGQDNSGMKFKLQIGKYKQFDISNFFENKKLMSFEKDENGLFIYTIGNFNTEYDAELFKSAMREIGVRDAFVAYYLDGMRVSKE